MQYWACFFNTCLHLQVGRLLLGRVSGIQGLCGGRVAETETKETTFEIQNIN